MVTPDTPLPPWLAAEYPFTPRQHRTASGARLSYLDEGPRGDEAVLMVHGNPTWSYYYRHLVRALSPSIRCIVPDHVGMGLSDKPQDHPYTLQSRIDDLSSLVASLGLKKVHLIVHDWGGAIGLGWAGANAGLVGCITILNTGAFRSTRIPARISLCKAPLYGPFIVRAFNAFAWPATWMAVNRRKLSSVERRAYLFPHQDWHDRVAVSGFVRDIPLSEAHVSYAALLSVEKGLANLKDKQIQLLWGGRDFCFNRHFRDRFLEIFPHAVVHDFPDAGHYVIEDERVAAEELVRSFLGL